jgi:hypothetical protein
LIDLCGQRVLEFGFRRDPIIRELVDFSSDQVRLRSAVAGEFILKSIVDPNITVQTLVSLATSAASAARVSRYYYSILKSLARYSNLQNLLPEHDRGRATMRYYESIKGFTQYKTNPLFWLQYATAALVIEEFDRAEKYFDTAYSFGKDWEHFDSYQIDNQYARFLLLRAIRTVDPSTCMTAFRKARSLIYTQMEKERLHYPYRVAAIIGEFYDTFAPLLKPQHKDEIKRAAKYICERIEKLPQERQTQRYVVDCWEKLQGVLASTA